MWRETLGLYCALDGPGGNSALVFSRVASYLHPPRFAAILEDFVERATIWRAYLARSADSCSNSRLFRRALRYPRLTRNHERGGNGNGYQEGRFFPGKD